MLKSKRYIENIKIFLSKWGFIISFIIIIIFLKSLANSFFEPDEENLIKDGDFDKVDKTRPIEWSVIKNPGTAYWAGKLPFNKGNSTLLMGNKFPEFHATVVRFNIPVKPRKYYYASIWIKNEQNPDLQTKLEVGFKNNSTDQGQARSFKTIKRAKNWKNFELLIQSPPFSNFANYLITTKSILNGGKETGIIQLDKAILKEAKSTNIYLYRFKDFENISLIFVITTILFYLISRSIYMFIVNRKKLIINKIVIEMIIILISFHFLGVIKTFYENLDKTRITIKTSGFLNTEKMREYDCPINIYEFSKFCNKHIPEDAKVIIACDNYYFNLFFDYYLFPRKWINITDNNALNSLIQQKSYDYLIPYMNPGISRDIKLDFYFNTQSGIKKIR